MRLTVGTHNETMTVDESPAEIETANTHMGDLIGGSKIAGMPVNGRSYTDLLALQPGVTPVSRSSRTRW